VEIQFTPLISSMKSPCIADESDCLNDLVSVLSLEKYAFLASCVQVRLWEFGLYLPGTSSGHTWLKLAMHSFFQN
jgi:hypothetical protein